MSGNKIISIQVGESLPFKFDRGGDSITNWTCDVSWKQFPSDNINIPAETATIADGGTGYAIDDQLIVSGGSGTAAVFNVDSVSSGVVTAVTVVPDSEGDYTVVPDNPASTTGGSGTGCTLTITYGTAKTRTIAVADDGLSWDGFLTNTETDILDTGLWWLTGTLINLVTDELEQIPVRFNVTKKWA